MDDKECVQLDKEFTMNSSVLTWRGQDIQDRKTYLENSLRTHGTKH